MALNRRKRILDSEGLSEIFAKEEAMTNIVSTITGHVGSSSFQDFPRTLRGYQVTDSEGHPWFPKKSRPEGDIGGPFKTRKIYVKNASHLGKGGQVISGTVRYDHANGFCLPGPFDGIVSSPGNVFQESKYPDLSSSDSELNALGATAISRCNPVNPILDASVAIAELYREGLPSITLLKALKDRNLSSIGDEFLNWQFGWKPILSDLKDLATALRDKDTILKQLRRDSGRLVRRSYEFPTEKKVLSESTNNGSLLSSFPGSFYSGSLSGITAKKVTIEKQRWFSGAFTYHLPDSSELGGISRMVDEGNKLFGLVPDLETLWNLIPWSWGVDWFVNVGPVLSNLSDMAKYDLVMPYGYMMETTIVEYQYTYTGAGQGPGREGCSMIIVDETKKRLKASPFGFGVSWDSFDTTQLAILAALGLSRSPF